MLILHFTSVRLHDYSIAHFFRYPRVYPGDSKNAQSGTFSDYFDYINLIKVALKYFVFGFWQCFVSKILHGAIQNGS